MFLMMFYAWELKEEIYIEDGSTSGGDGIYFSASDRNTHNLYMSKELSL